MKEKRKRRAASPVHGLATGERLNRNRLFADSDLRWSWIGTHAKHVSEITKEHKLRASGLTLSKSRHLCRNKYLEKPAGSSKQQTQSLPVEPEDHSDVIIISEDEEDSTCSKKQCKDNPFCLNYLGQDNWEDEEGAFDAYLSANLKEEDPRNNTRKDSTPVGLRNLGATCYANAFLQVWFQDLAFRSGVYKCQPLFDKQHQFKDSPIFQLQVTFAALQEGNQAVFNPVKLVESLKLRTSEQQDAQEFSKLFMCHLDDEFKKQPNPELRSLLPDQFEGRIIHATVCDKCKTRSERSTTFLELEVNLEKNSVLEDRIAAILAPERLTDDNKYLCSVCDNLQDATRYTEIHTLPPVLHVSLLRFVYDLTTYERKKTKLPVKFPPYLNMKPFLQSSEPNHMDVVDSGDVYELRGVLLHKGLSAYHGHYEAQVFSSLENKWYQFNDECVSALASFHAPKNTKSCSNPIVIDDDEPQKPAKRQKKAAKARRIEDSDNDEVQIVTPSNLSSETRYLISRDAYMLIYARRGEQPGKIDAMPVGPPQIAMENVRSMNVNHENECAEFVKKQDAMREQFAKTRAMVLDIYRSWSLSSTCDPFVVVSRAAMERWLSHCLNSADATKVFSKPKESATPTLCKDPHQNGESGTKSEPGTDEFPDFLFVTSTSASTGVACPTPVTIDSSNLLCRHDRLNPFLDKEMKLMSVAARDRIGQCGFTFKPEFTVDDICDQCVEEEFLEKLYQIEHPLRVSEFNAICNARTENEGYWISKPWLKDWQLNKPKMHITSRGDPPPDGPDFGSHVECEHDGLALNVSSRRRISREGVLFLKQLFPNWQPPEWDAEPCPVCDAMVHISKEGKLEQRKKAENEKAQLSRLHEDNVFGRDALTKDTTCAILPSVFIRTWRSWLSRPGDNQRPTVIDNSYLLCDHAKLNLDLSNAGDFDEDIAVVTTAEWDILEALFEAGPLITVKKVTDTSEAGIEKEEIITDIPCCLECRTRCKLDFLSTSLTVILLGSSDPVPQHSYDDSNSKADPDLKPFLLLPDDKNGVLPKGQSTLLPSLGKANGTRQSKRLKEGKHSRRRLVAVHKTMTVKDMKVAIQRAFGVPTISQLLYYRGKELDNNLDTVAHLQILERDVLYLKEADEDVVMLDSDVDRLTKAAKKREGDAFKGTLLSGPFRAESTATLESDDNRIKSDNSSGPKFCAACTFENPADASDCNMCFTSFS